MLIDELSLGLAPIVIDSLIETIAQVNQTGVTVLLVEQDVQVAFEIASWAMSWKPDTSPFPAMPRVCSTMNGASRLIWDCDSGLNTDQQACRGNFLRQADCTGNPDLAHRKYFPLTVCWFCFPSPNPFVAATQGLFVQF